MTDIDLTPFCDPSRERFSAPFSIGEHTYASDGRVLVRVPRRPDVPERDDMPKAAALMAANTANGYAPISVAEMVPEIEECDSCFGEGAAHECPSCDCPCVKCDGKGRIEKWPFVNVDGLTFAGKYIRLISTLPGLIVARTQPSNDSGKAFRFDGGDGLLMPIYGWVHNAITAREPQP